MKSVEEELINELMRLTGQSREEMAVIVDSLKQKALAGHKMAGDSRSFSYKGTLEEDGYAGEDGEEFDDEMAAEHNAEEDIMDYPRYIPDDEVEKFTLRFTLRHIRPSIWRKVEVPSNITLRHLAELIIEVMGWGGYHMYQFRIDNYTYYEPKYQRDAGMEEMAWSPIRHYSQEEHTIKEVLKEKGKHIIFEYDFGDGWEHEIRLSSVGRYADGEERAIRFVYGKRACPPEDCGGVWGYEELCELHTKKAAGKRLSRDDRERLEWYANTDDGKDYDPELLDLDACIDATEMLNDE